MRSFSEKSTGMRLRSKDKKTIATPPPSINKSVKKVKREVPKEEPHDDEAEEHNHAEAVETKELFLEKGHVSFFYRPKVMLENASSHDNLSRFFVLLKPLESAESDRSISRLILIAKKHLPDLESHEKLYAFVWKMGDSYKLMEYLDSKEYDTVTRGHRTVEKARPCGCGVYGLVRKQKRTYLAFVLEFPEIPAQVQISLNLKKEGSYLLLIKNPKKLSAPETEGTVWPRLGGSSRAHYEDDLQKSFQVQYNVLI